MSVENKSGAVESVNEPGVDTILANQANADEHLLGKIATIKQNPWGFAWCLYTVWVVLLVSYEGYATGSILGIPQFRKDFGNYYEGSYVLAAEWQSAFSGAPTATQLFGAITSGFLADKIGRKYMFMLALVLSYVAITIEFVATTPAVFFVGKLIYGIVMGIIQIMSATYMGEITPLALRGLMTCLLGLAYTFGSFIVSLIVNETGTWTTRWAYRAVFCSQYGFAGVVTLFILFMPESPWWLASQGRDEAALVSLRKLGYKDGSEHMRLAGIKQTLQEVQSEAEETSYLECFRKSNLRRTIISIAPFSFQQFTGVTFAASYATYYMQLAGYSTSTSFKLSVLQQVISILGNVTSWFTVDRFGRRFLTLYGTIAMTVVLWIMGGLAVGGSPSELKGTVAMIMIYSYLYNISLGATAYTVMTEVPTARLRTKTLAIGQLSMCCWSLMWNFVMPYLFNPDHANLGGKVGFIFGGFCFFCVTFLWWYLPETKGRTYEELDEMFMKKVPARQFGTYVTETETRGQLELKMMKSEAEN